MLASADDAGIRNGSEALKLARQAGDLTGGGQPFVLDALAMAQAECGQFQEAKQTAARAVELATAAGAEEMVRGLKERWKLYGENRPFRDGFTNVSASTGAGSGAGQ